MPTLDELASEAHAHLGGGTSLDDLAAEAHGQLRGQQTTDTSNGYTPPLAQRLWEGVKGYASIPGRLIPEAGTQLGLGVTGALHAGGLIGDQTLQTARDIAQQEAEDTERATIGAPGAGKAAQLIGGVAPFLIPGVGIPLGAASMGGGTYDKALQSGATPDQAKASGLIGAGVGALLPGVSRALAPVAEGLGVGAKALADKVVGEHAGTVVGDTVAGGAEGYGAGLALGAGNAGATSVYDPAQALEELKRVPEEALALGAFGGAGRGLPSAVRVTGDARVDRQQTVELAQQAEKEALWRSLPDYERPTEPLSAREVAERDADPNTPEAQQAALEMGQVLSAANRQALISQAMRRPGELSAITDEALGEKPRGPIPEPEVPDLAAEGARQTLADQERISAENDARAARRQAFLLRENLKSAEEEGLQGAHVYDAQGRLTFDPEARNPFYLPLRNLQPRDQLDAARAFVRKHLGDDEGAFAADDPTIDRRVADFRMREKPLPPEIAEGIKTSSPARDPDIESLASMSPDQRNNALKGLSAEARQRVLPQVIKRVNELRAEKINQSHIHGFNEPSREVNRARGLRENQETPAAGGNVGPRSEIPRGQDLQLPAEARTTAGDQRARSADIQGGDRPAVGRLKAVRVNNIADLHRGLRDVYGLKDEEATAATALVRARAAALGVDADTFARQRIAEVRHGEGTPSLNQRGQKTTTLNQGGDRIVPRGTSLAFDHLLKNWRKANGDRTPVPGDREWQSLREKADAIDQQRGVRTLHQDERGAVSFIEDGRAVIHALNKPEASTAFHELGHIFRRTLNAKDQEIAGRWAGARQGIWGRSAEEKFALGFERYLRDGQAPVPALRRIFDQMRTWLRTIYQSIKGSPIDIQISPEVRALFDRMLTPAKGHELTEESLSKSHPRNESDGASSSPDQTNLPTRISNDKPITTRKGEELQGNSAEKEENSQQKPALLTTRDTPLAIPATDKSQRQAIPATDTGKSSQSVGRTTAEQKEIAKSGRPELANPASETAVRQLVRQAREKMVSPERKTQEQSIAEGRELLNDDQRTTALRDKVRGGEPLTDVETAAFRELLDREGADAIESGGQKLRQTLEAIQGYTAGGTEQARALGMRRDRNQSPEDRRKMALTHAILMPSQRLESQFSKLRDRLQKASPKDRPDIQKTIDQLTTKELHRIEKFKRRMAGLGFDLDRMDLLYQNSKKAAALVDEARIDKGDNWDAAYEWWMSSILSGPRTNITNAVGNVGNMLLDVAWEKPIQLLLNQIPGLRSHGPSAGELGSVYKALFSGDAWGFATRHFADTWSAERPMLDAEMASGRELSADEARLLSDQGGKFNSRAPLNRNIAARMLRNVSLRPMQAVDQFFKGLVARSEVAGRAYRLAKEHGYEVGSDKFQEFVNQEVADLESRSWEHAYDEAKQRTFSQEPGPITQGVVNLRNKVPGARYVVPFVPILVSLIGRGMKIGPVTSQINMARRIVQQGLWKYSPTSRGALPYARSEFIKDFAASTAGLLAMGVIGSWAADGQDGLPNMTGTESRYIKAKDQTVPGKSIRMFGKYYSYDRLDPFSGMLATTIDALKAWRSKTSGDAIDTALGNLKYQVLDKSFMQTLGDVNRSIGNAEGGTNTAARLLRGILVGFIPNVIRQPLAASQDDAKDQGIYAQAKITNADWWKEQGRVGLGQIAAGLPFVPKVDLWGQTQEKDTPTEKLASDFLWRALSPSQVAPGNASNVYEQAIYNWNKNAEKPLWPAYPRNYIERRDKTRWYYDEKTYNEMLRERGRLTMEELKDWKPEDPVHPTDQEMRFIQRALRIGNRLAQQPYRIKAKAVGSEEDQDE